MRQPRTMNGRNLFLTAVHDVITSYFRLFGGVSQRFSLNLIRDLIGNQCSDLSRGLESESLLDLVTTHYSDPQRHVGENINKISQLAKG